MHIPSNDERQMQIRKFQSDAKTHRVRLHPLANQYVLKKSKIGIYTGSHRDHSESATSKRSNYRRKIFRMDFEHERNSKNCSLDFTQERVQNSRSFCWTSEQVLQTKSREQCCFTFWNYVTREREFVEDSGASL